MDFRTVIKTDRDRMAGLIVNFYQASFTKQGTMMKRDLIAHRAVDFTRFACCFLISTVATFIISRLYEGSNDEGQIEVQLGTLFPIFSLIIAPLWETIVFQTLPSFLSDTFSWSIRTMWLAMILPFVLSHIDPNYYCLSFANGLIGGASLAYVLHLLQTLLASRRIPSSSSFNIMHNAIFALT